MGIGNFFDNFMGGLAFGMLTGFSFGRWGGGCCGFGFPMMSGISYQSDQFNCLFDNSFQNSFPKLDFSNITTSIWDNVNQSMDNYMKMQSKLDTSSIPLSTCKQMYTPYSMPFSSYYFQPFYMSFLTGYTPTAPKEEKPAQQSLEPTKTDTEETRSKKTEKSNESKLKTQTENSGTTREFASIYQNLGITDKRFQKIFEECVLSMNEGRKRGEDYNIFDVKAMNKNGVLQPTYDEYRVKEKHLPKRDVKNMTLEEMCEIYYTMFYVKGGAKDIKDDRLSLYVFDSDVNMGVGTGKTLLSRSGNNAKKFEEERRIEYSRRKNFNTYKKTWYNRIENTKKYADDNFTAVA